MRYEITSIPEFDARLAEVGDVRNCFIQAVHLNGYNFDEIKVAGSIFLGCKFDPGAQSAIRRGGGLIFPRIPNLPFNPYRAHLWQAEDLYHGIHDGYQASLDGTIYRWWKKSLATGDLEAEIACTLHDHSISDAVHDLITDDQLPHIIGIMGGHAAIRGNEAYRQVVELGWSLTTAGKTVVTGGGPGAMEAANLGGASTDDLATTLSYCDRLAGSPTWAANPTGWVKTALAVKQSGHFERLTLGVPTWFYGHEPPNVFATGIAKYFNNALREEMLLHLAGGGVIYTPGAAGTVQEVFELMTNNYYAKAPNEIVPMVFLNRDYWTNQLPVWPLVTSLAAGRYLAPHIHLVDTVAEAVEIFTS